MPKCLLPLVLVLALGHTAQAQAPGTLVLEFVTEYLWVVVAVVAVLLATARAAWLYGRKAALKGLGVRVLLILISWTAILLPGIVILWLLHLLGL